MDEGFRGRSIKQFMWGYQHYFRSSAENGAKATLEAIGLHADVEFLLVGFCVAGEHEFPICIEPEDGPYEPGDLASVAQEAEEIYRSHPDSGMWYSVQHIQDRKHASMMDWARGRAVCKALGETPAGQGKEYFAGRSARVGDYEVHPVLGVDRDTLASIPRLQKEWHDRYSVDISLAHSVIFEVLGGAFRAMHLPDAGADLTVLGSDTELIRKSANRLIRSTLIRAGYDFGEDYDLLISGIAALPYEGRAGAGRVILAKSSDPAIDLTLRLRNPVHLNDARAVRKLIEASGEEADLISDGETIYGFGRVQPDYDTDRETVFVITMKDRGLWHLSNGDQVLLTMQDGRASLPSPPFDAAYFLDLADRILPGSRTDKLLQLAEAASRNLHGTMLVVSSDAGAEAARLAPQAWATEPQVLSSEFLRQLTKIDGAILLDTFGACHGMGVILDGMSCGKESPARGSRYNNAIRYLQSQPPPAIVIVYSADGTIDILPKLRPRVTRQEVEESVGNYVRLAGKTPPDLRRVAKARNLVERYEFYLSEEQCMKVNDANGIVDTWRRENSNLRLIYKHLEPHPDMNDSYWIGDKPAEQPDIRQDGVE